MYDAGDFRAGVIKKHSEILSSIDPEACWDALGRFEEPEEEFRDEEL